MSESELRAELAADTEKANEFFSEVSTGLTQLVTRAERIADRTDRAQEYLKELGENLGIDIIHFFDLEEENYTDMYQRIYDAIEDNNGFDCEVIYYQSAMQYLKENDDSLKISLQLAHECGYTLENLNSEILASLLKSDTARDDFHNEKSEITEFFDDLQSEVEEDEEREEETV